MSLEITQLALEVKEEQAIIDKMFLEIENLTYQQDSILSRYDYSKKDLLLLYVDIDRFYSQNIVNKNFQKPFEQAFPTTLNIIVRKSIGTMSVDFLNMNKKIQFNKVYENGHSIDQFISSNNTEYGSERLKDEIQNLYKEIIRIVHNSKNIVIK